MKNLMIFDGYQPGLDIKKSLNGTRKKVRLNRTLECYFFDFESPRDFNLQVNPVFSSCFYLCVNLSKKEPLKLIMGQKSIVIPPYASFLIPYQDTGVLSIKGDKNRTYNFIILKVDKNHLYGEQLQLMDDLHAEDAFWNNELYENGAVPNLEICEVARKLNNLKIKNCENKFIASGFGNILIGLKLKEFSAPNDFRLSYLRDHEIHQIEKITHMIIKNPQEHYRIKDLCRQSGLSVSKLQAGFKSMHNCTVAIFIRNVRLEKALELLKTTDMNVSEIVYSVGLNSRGYFSRIFKKKYKCSPKYFQQQLKNTIQNAS